MSVQVPVDRKTQLAFAIAQGRSVTSWARENQVPRSTAYRWARDTKVCRLVQICRCRARDRVIGQMARRVTSVSDQIADLATDARSESVRLRALRALFSGVVVAVPKFPASVYRRAKIEAI
jgi:hypothetical protein